MTEADLVEHAQMAYGNATASFAILLSVISAYLVTAYLAGRELKSSQVVMINFFFIVSCVITVGTIFGFISAGINSSLEAFSLNPERGVVTLHPSMSVIVCFFDLALILGSLKFMWDVRHPKAE